MRDILFVRWHIVSEELPLVWRHCPGCGINSLFACSERFRCNLQKKRLDVWLIYRCRACGNRWNLPILERSPVNAIEPVVLHAFTTDCPHQVRRYAADTSLLRRHGGQPRIIGASNIKKIVLESGDPPFHGAVVEIHAPLAGGPRLDRLCTAALSLSRSKLQALIRGGVIDLRQDDDKTWRRSARNGQQLTLDFRRPMVLPELRDDLLGKLLR